VDSSLILHRTTNEMAGLKAVVAVALLLCLSLSAADAASKQKKKAVVTHKVSPLLSRIYTLPSAFFWPSAHSSCCLQVFFDVEIDGKPAGKPAVALTCCLCP
jgi:hypothetical protein